MTIQGIHHASLLVADCQRALEFYCGLLGLPLDPKRPDLGYAGAWLDLPDGRQIHLLQLANPDPVDGRAEHGGRDRHLALAVTDLPELQLRLQQAGVAFSLSRSGRPALFCRDPDGNALEFIGLGSS
jgi:glyoxylase I family protein